MNIVRPVGEGANLRDPASGAGATLPPVPYVATTTSGGTFHSRNEVVLSLKILSCVTTNESGLMIPPKPASIMNEPPRIKMNPAKAIQPTAALLGSLLDIRTPL